MELAGLLGVLLHLELLVAALVDALVQASRRHEQLLASFLLLFFLFFLFGFKIYIRLSAPLLKSSMFLITMPGCCFSKAFAALLTVFDLKNYYPLGYWSVCGPAYR